MEREQLPLGGAMLLRPRIYSDERGLFRELYSAERYRELGIGDEFVQDNLSISGRGVLRGLHGDARMSKLAGPMSGSVFDVIVDLRPASPTYRRWYGTTLRASEGTQIYVPHGFLHGFLALEDETIFGYKQSAAYDPAHEFAVAWNDPEIGIEWPLGSLPPILSPRDAAAPLLASLPKP